MQKVERKLVYELINIIFSEMKASFESDKSYGLTPEQYAKAEAKIAEELNKNDIILSSNINGDGNEGTYLSASDYRGCSNCPAFSCGIDSAKEGTDFTTHITLLRHVNEDQNDENKLSIDDSEVSMHVSGGRVLFNNLVEVELEDIDLNSDSDPSYCYNVSYPIEFNGPKDNSYYARKAYEHLFGVEEE